MNNTQVTVAYVSNEVHGKLKFTGLKDLLKSWQIKLTMVLIHRCG